MSDRVVFVTGKTGPQGETGPQGPQGIQGEPGADGVGQPYVHTQSVASASWVIGHNFGRKVSVTLLDDNDVVVHADVQHGTLNQTTITFPVPTTGTAVII